MAPSSKQMLMSRRRRRRTLVRLLRELPDLNAWAKDQESMVMVAMEEETLLQVLPAVRPFWLGRLPEQRSQQLFHEKIAALRFCMHVASACI